MFNFVFPGQGSQYIRMGKELFDNFSSAREVFAQVDDALSENLSKLIFTGDNAQLQQTVNTQPSIMAVSVAIVRTLKQEFNVDINKYAHYFLGHSLGEYSALCVAGSINLENTAKLLRARGIAMQKAVIGGEGGMSAILGLTYSQVKELLLEINNKNEICEIANHNTPVQIVVSGHKNALAKLPEIAKKHGAKKIIPLSVSAPFHSSLMAPAQSIMQQEFANIDNPQKPIVDIIGNVTAKVIETHGIVPNLIQQIVGNVRWVESVQFSSKCKNFIEIGPSKVLCGLIKKIIPDCEVSNIENIADLENFVEKISKLPLN